MPHWLTKFTALRKNQVKLCLLLAVLLFRGIHANSQSDDGKLYANVNAGFGMLYGGLGGNAELGTGHFSAFGALGYAPLRVLDTIRINPTVNYQFGLRYYFNVGSDVIFPRVGLGYGWITNYYNELIGNAPYKQKVQGLSLHLGTQFYSPEGIVVNFDIAAGSKYGIVNANEHPHFFGLYVRPSIGLGIDLTQFFSDRKKSEHIRNKVIDPLAP